MIFRKFFILAVLGICLPGLHEDECGAAQPSKPNVILCMADDQGWGDMAYMGDPVLKTPVFDEMARTALRFDRFYAAAPVCSPTRGSVLTGRHPNRFGCFKWGHTLRPQEVTIAEVMKKAGYATGHFGKWHLGSVRVDSPVCPGNSGFDEWLSAPNFYENNPWMSHNGKAIRTQGESSHVTVEYALNWIKSLKRGEEPFLAVIWFGNPHSPHVATKEYLRMYRDQPKAKANFYGEITAMDAAMGVLRNALRELEIADNTLLWYTSDNGAIPAGSTGGLRGRKGNLYEGGIRVPAIIEWPSVVKSHRTLHVPCSTVDIYPTLLELAGVTIDRQPVLDGQSILPLIRGRAFARRSPLAFWDEPVRGKPRKSDLIVQQLAKEQAGEVPGTMTPDLDAGKIAAKWSFEKIEGHSALIDDDFKLHRIPGRRDNSQVKWKLYNLKDDAKETTNILDDHPGRVKTMQAALETWLKSAVGSLNGEDY